MTQTRSRKRPTKHAASIHVEHRSSGQTIDEKVTPSVTNNMIVNPNMARVRVEGSVTQNMGDFNSVRVSIAIEFPCEPLMTHVDETYQMLSEHVDELLEHELKIATGATNE